MRSSPPVPHLRFSRQNPFDNFLLADGGLWANNPSTVAFTEALSVFGKETQEVRMLSVGTGHSVDMYRNRRGMGIYHGVGWCETDILCDDTAISGICKDSETAVKGELPANQPRN